MPQYLHCYASKWSVVLVVLNTGVSWLECLISGIKSWIYSLVVSILNMKLEPKIPIYVYKSVTLFPQC